MSAGRFAPRCSSVRRPSVFSWFCPVGGVLDELNSLTTFPSERTKKKRRSKNNEEMLLNKGKIFAGVFFHLFTFVLSVCVCLFVFTIVLGGEVNLNLPTKKSSF